MDEWENYDENHGRLTATREWWGVCLRHNEIHREVFDLSGDKIGEEFVTENHAITMYEPFLTYDEQT